MQIEVISVEVSKVPGKKYNQIDVAYRNDKGEVKGRKVMSFGIKEGLPVLTGAKQGDKLNVALEQKDGYWNWVGVTKADGSQPTMGASTIAKTYSSGGYDRESKEERAARQVLIVRQSCLSTAVALYGMGKVVPQVSDVIEVAKQLEAYVFSKDNADAPQGAEATVE